MSHRVMILAAPFMRHEPKAGAPLREAGVEVLRGPLEPLRTASEVIDALQGCDGVIASMEPYTAEVFDALPRLKSLARWGVGYDSIDIEAASAARVIVTNTPGRVTESVADQTFCLMLALARRLPEQMSVARSCDWCQVEGIEIWNKTLGIIGLGSIGQAVARRAGGFSMRVLAHDPYAEPFHAGRLNASLVSLEELIAESDVITLHAVLTEETQEMIGEEQLRAMKPSALLINCGRGGLVDQSALVRALEEEWIAGAALDALAPEPPAGDDPVLSAPNTIMTPHNSSMTAESAARVNATVCENMLCSLKGQKPRFVVNTAVLD